MLKGGARRLGPPLALFAMAAGMVLTLRLEGRSWLCSCGRAKLWTGEAWGAETSQQFLDPYSLTHMLHGFALCGLMVFLLAPRLGRAWQLSAAVAIESLWEVIENSRFVISRYRETTAALGYAGDSILNSLGDVTACAFGFLLAVRLGLRLTLILFAAVEAALIFWIRDSLLLNILLLLYPIEEIRAWQAAGH